MHSVRDNIQHSKFKNYYFLNFQSTKIYFLLFRTLGDFQDKNIFILYFLSEFTPLWCLYNRLGSLSICGTDELHLRKKNIKCTVNFVLKNWKIFCFLNCNRSSYILSLSIVTQDVKTMGKFSRGSL